MKDITDIVNDVCTDCCGLQLRPRWTCPIRLVTVCTGHYIYVRATACPVKIRAHHHIGVYTDINQESCAQVCGMKTIVKWPNGHFRIKAILVVFFFF